MYPEEVKNYITGSCSDHDEQVVRRWLEEDPNRQEVLEEPAKVWVLTGELHLLNEGELQQAWGKVGKNIYGQHEGGRNAGNQTAGGRKRRGRTHRMSSSYRIVLQVAAVMMLALGMYTFFSLEEPAPEKPMTAQEPVYQTIRADFGEQVQVRLKDGTRAILNAGSHLRFNDAYGKENRTIELHGEAFFEVNNDGQNSPFIVTTQQALIRDIGTSFNVNAYEENTSTEVVVAEGKVAVSAGNDSSSSKPVSITKGQMAQVDRNQELAIRPVDVERVLAWMEERLIFDNESFADIARRLERFFDVEIRVASDSLNHKRITASFHDDPMRDVMSVLATSLNAQVEIRDQQISFTTNDQ